MTYYIVVPRHWSSFDKEVTNAEFLSIPSADRYALFRAMGRYGRSEEAGYVVKNYGDGLMMIKATNQTSGRCLFFTVRESKEGSEELIALLGYKKESQEAPKSVIETARERMKRAQGE